VLFAFLTATALIIKKTEAEHRKPMFVLCLCTVAAGMNYFFPSFFRGPYAGVEPDVIAIWLKQVNEVQPLLSFDRQGSANIVLLLGHTLLTIPYLLILLVKRVKIPDYWWTFIYGSIMFSILALYQSRWAAYAEIISIIPTVLLLSCVLQRMQKVQQAELLIVLRVLVITFFCLAPIVIGTALLPERSSEPKTITKAVDFLNQLDRTSTILTDNDFGPEILYRTRHQVIATPYHRNGAGIMFGYHVMTAETDQEAFELLRMRKVDYILLYPESSEKVIYLNTKSQDTFYRRLLAGQYPLWLRPLILPPELAGEIIIYKVGG
jgi:hypothetical protein